jgi:mycoredoxin
MDNLGPTPEEAQASAAAIDKTINFFTSKRGILVIILVLLAVIAFIYTVYSLINGWVQCMDGYNYSSEVVDGETLYINQCDAY